MSPRQAPVLATGSPKASFAARLFGYDVFISFALGGPPRGSQSYASDLARRLRERDLSVFFSEDELPPGEPLSDTLRRALLRSRLLVVIVNRGTLELPNWVRTEVETFRSNRPGRPVIPVCLDRSFLDRPLSDAAQPWLQHDGHVWLDEQADAAVKGLATDELVARLLTAPRRLRANALWRTLVAAVALGLAALGAAAAWQAVVATRERDRATELRDQALSRQLAAQSTAALLHEPDRALLLAVQSHAIMRTPASDSALLGALAALPLASLYRHEAAFQSLALQPHTDMLLLADVRGAVLQRAAGQPDLQYVVQPSAGPSLFSSVHALAFAPDGQTWARAGSSREITVLTRGKERTIPDGDKIGEDIPMFVLGLAFSPDGQRLAWSSTRGSLHWHELAQERTFRLLGPSAHGLSAVVFGPGGQWVAAGGDDGFLQAFPLARGMTAPRLQASPLGTVMALILDSTGQRLIVASRGGRIEVLDTRDGRRIEYQDVPEQGSLEAMAMTPDGQFIATGHGNGAVLLWSMRNKASRWPRQQLLRHAAPVLGLAFAADGRTLVSAGADAQLFVSLPVNRGRWQQQPGPGPARAPVPVLGPGEVRSPDGRWIAWAGTLTDKPSPFKIDFTRRQAAQLPRLTLVRAADRQPVVDGAELRAEPGEAIVAGPVFAADASALAVQVADRVLFWDLADARPSEAALGLPAGTGLIGPAPDGAGWLAGSDAMADRHFMFGTDRRAWVVSACTLAGRSLTKEEWRRYVGDDRVHDPACRPGRARSSGPPTELRQR